MFYLLLAMASSLLLNILFKLFAKYNIDTLQAIVYNYVVCVITGGIFLGESPINTEVLSAPWFPFALAMGLFFMAAFFFVAQTVVYFGIAISSVVQRMSLVISVPFAIIVMQEPNSWNKMLGVVLALLAVLLTNKPSITTTIENNTPTKKALDWSRLFFPLAIFLTSGIIECALQYIQVRLLPAGGNEGAWFSITTFGIAACAGLCWLFMLKIRGKLQLAPRHFVAGIALGIPNYFSIFFLLKSFESIDKSVALSVNNIAIVAASALLGFFFFKEKLSWINWMGVGLAVGAIALISLL